jgi:D-sedoheptulose 7-phosphate isomerase
MLDKIKHCINESVTVKAQLEKDQQMLHLIGELVDLMVRTFRNGNHVYFCGNGGSAADAQHLAAEFSGRFYINREPLPAEALHCNTSYLTAVANDFSYDIIYARLIQAMGKKGDMLIGLSTSGNSPNIVQAFDMARGKGIITVGFTGESGGLLKDRSDYLVNVPSAVTPRIQEAHMLIGHIICQLVEEQYFGKQV